MSMEYTTEPGDSLPHIAEAFGHPGEWQALAALNEDLPDPHNIQPGMAVMIPEEWVEALTESEEESSETSSSSTKKGTTTSSEPENPPSDVAAALEEVEQSSSSRSSSSRSSSSHSGTRDT